MPQPVNCHLPKAKSRRRKRILSNRKDQWKRTLPTSNDPNSKASLTSNRKWQNQARQFILNWTPKQMDAYLAIPEVAAASLYALWIGSRMVLDDVVFNP
jgi:hypothetical protein